MVQALHVQACIQSSPATAQSIVLDARPAPHLSRREIVSTPYCDSTHALSLDPVTAEEGKVALAKTLEDWVFTLHEEMSATSCFPTLGVIIDGKTGVVKPREHRFRNLRLAFDCACKRPVSSDLVQRL